MTADNKQTFTKADIKKRYDLICEKIKQWNRRVTEEKVMNKVTNLV